MERHKDRPGGGDPLTGVETRVIVKPPPGLCEGKWRVVQLIMTEKGLKPRAPRPYDLDVDLEPVIYKKKDSDVILWKSTPIPDGLAFSFDGERWRGYPYGYRTLTDEEREIFDRENPEKVEYLRSHWMKK